MIKADKIERQGINGPKMVLMALVIVLGTGNALCSHRCSINTIVTSLPTMRLAWFDSRAKVSGILHGVSSTICTPYLDYTLDSIHWIISRPDTI